jgi:prepilin signal peptidase PulO-like enzyme (type II secretory pathway)
MVYGIWTGLFLLICSITDLKEKKIYSPICFLNAFVGLIVNFITQNIPWTEIFLGIMLGGVFFCISVFTKESIGKGDAIVIFALGSINGIKESFEILVWALMLCAVISTVCLAIKKIRLKNSIPFIPFLFAGAVITFFIQGG